jgi:hypothetical protein
VMEVKRSSLTGPVEGEPVVIPGTEGPYRRGVGAPGPKGMTFDAATGQLFVEFGGFGEVLNGAHEVVGSFGAGAPQRGRGLAVNEATGELYVVGEIESNIYRFGPGVTATAPVLDQPAPSVAALTRTSAQLSATIDTGDATTSWKLEYVAASQFQPGAANPYASGGSTATVKLAPSATGTEVGPVPLTGLLAGTTYHYRLVAVNELGATDGEDHTFTTAAVTPPLATTGTASEVTQTGVLLSGTVDSQELQTSYEFEVGLDTSYGGAKLFGNAGNGGTEAVSASLQYLIPGVTYHYRLLASNEDGTSYGQDMTFTTPGVAAPIAQPPNSVFVPNPTVTFPSVAGAITKPRLTTKKKVKKRKRVRRGKLGAGKRKGKSRKGGAKRR